MNKGGFAYLYVDHHFDIPFQKIDAQISPGLAEAYKDQNTKREK